MKEISLPRNSEGCFRVRSPDIIRLEGPERIVVICQENCLPHESVTLEDAQTCAELHYQKTEHYTTIYIYSQK